MVFVGPSSPINVAAVQFVIIYLCPGALVNSGFRLLHASLGALPKPLSVILGVGFHMYMIA